MAISEEATTLARTYRYLRIAIATVPVVILVSVAFAIPVFGVLPSISHYFYTPARTGFTGALIAATACLFALSGRGLPRALLDIAAMFAPIIAIVPTVIAPGSVPGLDDPCTDICVPPPYDVDLDNGIATYLTIGVLALIVVAVLSLAGEVDRGAAASTIAVAGAILLVTGLTWWFAREAFVRYAHLVAAVAFFALTAAVAALEAVRPSALQPASRGVRIAYAVIAVGLAVDLIVTLALSDERFSPSRPVFVGETIALLLFLAFWVLQSVNKWRESDPSLLP